MTEDKDSLSDRIKSVHGVLRGGHPFIQEAIHLVDLDRSDQFQPPLTRQNTTYGYTQSIPTKRAI